MENRFNRDYIKEEFMRLFFYIASLQKLFYIISIRDYIKQAKFKNF